jgi:hypothetical protein
MSADLILATLAAGGEPAVKLANVIQKLVIEAGKLGELDIAIHVRSTGQILTEEQADDLPAEQLEAIKDHLVRVKRFPARAGSTVSTTPSTAGCSGAIPTTRSSGSC